MRSYPHHGALMVIQFKKRALLEFTTIPRKQKIYSFTRLIVSVSGDKIVGVFPLRSFSLIDFRRYKVQTYEKRMIRLGSMCR